MIGRGYGTLRIFYEGALSDYLEKLRSGVRSEVHGETADYLLNVNDEAYANHVTGKFSLDPLNIHFDDMYATPREEMIGAERFPGRGFEFNVDLGRSYPKQVFRYHIPYSGTRDLLRYTPNPMIRNTVTVELDNGAVCFDVVDFYGDPARVKAEADRAIDIIKTQFEHVRANVAVHNEHLPDYVRRVITERKQQLEKQISVAQSLGVPIKKSEHVPETFRAPVTRRQIVTRPAVPPGAGRPEPSLGDDVYQQILKVIHDTGKVFERLPSTYAGKDEESLRDHLILVLEPHFEGSATGETFNKAGKTDILIRHEKSNVFVAECKWWGGSKKHTDTIDQLLSYLTWRDSKSAIVVFVDRKDFTNALKAIDETTRGHPCFVRDLGLHDETRHDYELHLPDDQDRHIKVAVLAFHLPRGTA